MRPAARPLEEYEKRIGYRFQNKQLLETALTHMPRPVTQETVVLAGDITAKHQKAPELYQ